MSLLPKQCRVLVVDDDVDAAELMQQLLQMEGFSVQTAADLDEALAQALDFLPQVICIDIGVDGMAAIELGHRLRSHPDLVEALLVGMTGWDPIENPYRKVKTAFHTTYIKPVPIEALSSQIRRFCYK